MKEAAAQGNPHTAVRSLQVLAGPHGIDAHAWDVPIISGRHGMPPGFVSPPIFSRAASTQNNGGGGPHPSHLTSVASRRPSGIAGTGLVFRPLQTPGDEMPHYQKSRPAAVIGPLGELLTLETLPAPNTRRWVARRKAEVVAAVHGGLLTIEEACDRYRLELEELAGWWSEPRRSST